MTRSLLVYLPGYPYSAETLMPQHSLAAIATALTEAGHETHVLDYGTVDELASLTAGRACGALLGASAADLWETGGTLYARWSARRRRKGLTHLVRDAEARQRESVLAEIASYGRIDFIVLHIPRREDVTQALWLAEALREQQRETRLFLSGRHAAWYGQYLMEWCPALDACCTGDEEPAFVALAEELYDRESWRQTANLWVRESDGVVCTARDEIFNLNAFPAPVYDRDVYPAVFHGGKFRVFTVRESRGSDYVPHWMPGPSPGERHVRVRSARRVCEELKMLNKTCGARAFHFAGDGTPSSHFDAICGEMMNQNIQAWYSREGHVRNIDPETTAALFLSGCQAMSLRIDTGSQRLLDDYYGHEFCVTETENVLHACRRAGIFTVAGFTYPIPEDDYHSLAETMRLVRRTQPHAIEAHVPEMAPGSDWFDFAAEFGFRIDEGALAQWAATAPDPFGAAAADVPFAMKNRTAAQIRGDHEDFLGEFMFEKFALEISVREALLARVSDEYDNEAAYAERLRHLLLVGDADALAAHLSNFNEKAVAPSNTVRFTPYVPVRAVVGN